jgi:hypothetical protein
MVVSVKDTDVHEVGTALRAVRFSVGALADADASERRPYQT